MKLLLFVFYLIALCLAEDIPGGYSEKSKVHLDDPNVFRAVRECVKHINDVYNSTYKVNDFEVLNVQMKVVAGIVYKIHLAVPLPNHMGKHFKMEVFRDLSSNYSVETAEYLGEAPLRPTSK
ncbi:hypothetical protein GEMRC1_004020 [Eukaryota sp. GEM-RC1]